MMPSQSSGPFSGRQPVRVPSALKGEADPETLDSLDALVSSSRRLRRFWPLLAAEAAADRRPNPGFAVPARSRSMVAEMAEYGE